MPAEAAASPPPALAVKQEAVPAPSLGFAEFFQLKARDAAPVEALLGRQGVENLGELKFTCSDADFDVTQFGGLGRYHGVRQSPHEDENPGAQD